MELGYESKSRATKAGVGNVWPEGCIKLLKYLVWPCQGIWGDLMKCLTKYNRPIFNDSFIWPENHFINIQTALSRKTFPTSALKDVEN